jgi:hypothetical protein
LRRRSQANAVYWGTALSPWSRAGAGSGTSSILIREPHWHAAILNTKSTVHVYTVHGSLLKGGCGEASDWGAEPVEPGTTCNLRLPTESVVVGR